MPKVLRLLAPAKINLSLDVLGRRDDGYHTVEMVMQTIDLCDSITVELRHDDKIKVICQHPLAPGGPDNLAHRAADLLKKFSGSDLGVTITIDKRIPVAAGLGGGSADAAAVLKGLNMLWQLALSPEELSQVGFRLGADIPFCLLGGTALAEGIGEKLTPLPSPPRLWIVLLKPNVKVSTADIYSRYDAAAVKTRPNTQLLIEALATGDSDTFSSAMANVLETVASKYIPIIRCLKEKAMKNGALAAQMSGSGPTVFVLTSSYHQAEAIYKNLKHQVEFTHITTFREAF